MKKESKKFTVPNTFKKDKSHFYATNGMLQFPDGGFFNVTPFSQNMHVGAWRNFDENGLKFKLDPYAKVGVEKFNVLPKLGKKFVPLYAKANLNIPYADPSKLGAYGTFGFSGERTSPHNFPMFGFGELHGGYSGYSGAHGGMKAGADIFLSRGPMTPSTYENDKFQRRTLVGKISPHLRAGFSSGNLEQYAENATPGAEYTKGQLGSVGLAYGADAEIKYKFGKKFPGVAYAKGYLDFDPMLGSAVSGSKKNSAANLSDVKFGAIPVAGFEAGMRFPINPYKIPSKEAAKAKAKADKDAESARVRIDLELQRYQRELEETGAGGVRGTTAKATSIGSNNPQLWWESPTGQAEGPAQEQFQNVRGFTPTADFGNGGYMAPILPSPMQNPDTPIFRDTTALPFGYGGNMYAKGGPIKPLGISDPKEYAYRKAAYDDSLYLYKNNLQPLSLNSRKHFGTLHKEGVNVKPYRSQNFTSKYTNKPVESIAYGANDEYRSVPIYVDNVKKYQGTSPAFINYNKSKNFTKQIPANKPIKIEAQLTTTNLSEKQKLQNQLESPHFFPSVYFQLAFDYLA
jgi:hypothetical protein